MFFEYTYRPNFPITPKSSLHPKSSLSKNELSQNDSVFYFVVSSLKIVGFGIRIYFKKCVNGRGGFLTGSTLGIGPTGTWRRSLYFFDGSSSCASTANVWCGVFLQCQMDYCFHRMVIYFLLKLIVTLRLPLIIVTYSKCRPHPRSMCTLQRWIIISR